LRGTRRLLVLMARRHVMSVRKVSLFIVHFRTGQRQPAILAVESERQVLQFSVLLELPVSCEIVLTERLARVKAKAPSPHDH